MNERVHEFELSSKAFELFVLLAESPWIVVSQDEIYNRLWGEEEVGVHEHHIVDQRRIIIRELEKFAKRKSDITKMRSTQPYHRSLPSKLRRRARPGSTETSTYSANTHGIVS